jgi:hypothetical protein
MLMFDVNVDVNVNVSKTIPIVQHCRDWFYYLFTACLFAFCLTFTLGSAFYFAT